MPFVKVYIHFVWSTKDGFPYLNSQVLRQEVWQHIRENAQMKGIFVDFINGYKNHCHCLVSLNVDQTMSKIMQLVKGESSFWINRNKLCKSKFEWQDEYYAVSISESSINRVREYIKNQEVHHSIKTFEEEVDEFVAIYGFSKFYDTPGEKADQQ